MIRYFSHPRPRLRALEIVFWIILGAVCSYRWGFAATPDTDMMVRVERALVDAGYSKAAGYSRLERPPIEFVDELPGNALIDPDKRHLFDNPGNCRYSLKAAHAVITDGTPATSAGSSKHRIAKMKRCEAETKLHRAVMAGEAERVASRMRSRGFDKTKSRKFNGKVVARG